MKSDKVGMTINIGGELLKLDVRFDDQMEVREAEHQIKNYIERLRESWAGASDRKLIAMAAFQFASWYNKLNKIQNDAIELIHLKSTQIEKQEKSLYHLEQDSDFYNS